MISNILGNIDRIKSVHLLLRYEERSKRTVLTNHLADHAVVDNLRSMKAVIKIIVMRPCIRHICEIVEGTTLMPIKQRPQHIINLRHIAISACCHHLFINIRSKGRQEGHHPDLSGNTLIQEIVNGTDHRTVGLIPILETLVAIPYTAEHILEIIVLLCLWCRDHISLISGTVSRKAVFIANGIQTDLMRAKHFCQIDLSFHKICIKITDTPP